MSQEEVDYRQRGAATKRKRSQAKFLAAARPLFDKYGWHGVTLAQVATEAGLSAATLAYHYPTKQDLVLATYESDVRAVTESPEDVTSCVLALARLFTKHPALVAALILPPAEVVSQTATTMIDHITLGLAATRTLSPLTVDAARCVVLSLLLLVNYRPSEQGQDAAAIVLAQIS